MKCDSVLVKSKVIDREFMTKGLNTKEKQSLVGTMLVLLKAVPYGNLVQRPTSIRLQKHFHVVLKAMLCLFPWLVEAFWQLGLSAQSHPCGTPRTGAAKGDAQGLALLAIMDLEMCWGEVLGQGGEVS